LFLVWSEAHVHKMRTQSSPRKLQFLINASKKKENQWTLK